MLRFCKNLVHLFVAFLAGLRYGFPGRKMTVIGITGTSGKTTTSHLVYEILLAAGKKTALISTIGAYINGKTYDTGFHVTTPSSWQLEKFMRDAVRGGTDYFVLEVTSHALDQFRVFGASIDIGLVNNVSHEHIDYHKSLDLYRKAKAKILKGVRFSILNKDDGNFEVLRKVADGKPVTYSIKGPADYTHRSFGFKPQIPGRFNMENCLAAAAVASVVGIDKTVINRAIAGFSAITGRMEEVQAEQNFRIFVDFAHKPDALIQALQTARTFTEKRLIVIFGCAGLRDKLKRPMMGETAGRLADFTILTAEDPRTEDVRDIIGQIAQGCLKAKAIEINRKKTDVKLLKNGGKYFWRIPDRQEAINFAIRNLAQKGDVVLTCGKGHEKSMCWGKTEYPWDEKQAILKAAYGTIKNSY